MSRPTTQMAVTAVTNGHFWSIRLEHSDQLVDLQHRFLVTPEDRPSDVALLLSKGGGGEGEGHESEGCDKLQREFHGRVGFLS